MFDLNHRSFKFRITVSYLLIGLVLIAGIIAGIILMKQDQDTSYKAISGKEIQLLVDLSNNVNDSYTITRDYLLIKEDHLAESRNVIANKIKADLILFDSLFGHWDKKLANRIILETEQILDGQSIFEQQVKSEITQTDQQTFEMVDLDSEELQPIDADSTLPEVVENIGETEELILEETEIAGFEEEAIEEVPTIALETEDLFSYTDLSNILQRYDETILPLSNSLNRSIADLTSLIADNTQKGDASNGGILIILLIGSGVLTITLLVLTFILLNSTFKKSVDNAIAPLKILSKGDLPLPQEADLLEMEAITKEINTLTKNLGRIKDFAVEVGAGRYDSDIAIFNNEGEIGESLYEMRNSLKQIASDEKERSWMNEGFARFSDVLRQNAENLKLLSQNVISQLVKYMRANQGGIFILNDEDANNKFLELTACYAFERQKYKKKEIMPGEGLVGQCYLEKKSIYMTDIPSNYVHITSGLGGANPGNIFIAPLVANEEVLGIIEMASFQKFSKTELEFIEKTAESIASTISAVKIAEHTRRLLNDSQMAAEQLKSQEEEMRQNMEELAATQEEMHRNQKAIIENEQKTRLIFINAFDAIITFNEEGIIDLFNPAAERIFGYSYEEIKDRNINLMLSSEQAVISGDTVHSDSLVAKIGETRIFDAKRRNGEWFKMRVKVEEGTVGVQKIYLAFIEDISEENKLEENLRKVSASIESENNSLKGKLEVQLKSLQYIFNTSWHPNFKVDGNGNILESNETGKLLLKTDQVNSLTILDLIPDLKNSGGMKSLTNQTTQDKPLMTSMLVCDGEGNKFDANILFISLPEEANYLLAIQSVSEINLASPETLNNLHAQEQMVRDKMVEHDLKMKKIVAEENYILKKKKKNRK